MQEPKYSFIVPVYNTEKYVNFCIESILSQTYKDYELILINDGSNDNSKKVLNSYSNNESVRIIDIPNSGVSVARNIGLSEARGEYIVFVDSDDYINVSMLESIKEFDDDMIFFDYNEVNERDNLLTYKKACNSNMNQPLKLNHSSLWLFACKKNIYLKNNILFPEGLFHEDDAVIYKILFFSKSFSYVEMPLYFYRINRQGSTMNVKSQKMIDDLFVVTKNNIKYFKNKMSKDEYAEFVNDICVGKLFDYLIFDIIQNKCIDKLLKHKADLIELLDSTYVAWRKSNYFNSQSIIQNTFRKCLRHNLFVKIFSNNLSKTILRKRLHGNDK